MEQTRVNNDENIIEAIENFNSNLYVVVDGDKAYIIDSSCEYDPEADYDPDHAVFSIVPVEDLKKGKTDCELIPDIYIIDSNREFSPDTQYRTMTETEIDFYRIPSEIVERYKAEYETVPFGYTLFVSSEIVLRYALSKDDSLNLKEMLMEDIDCGNDRFVEGLSNDDQIYSEIGVSYKELKGIDIKDWQKILSVENADSYEGIGGFEIDTDADNCMNIDITVRIDTDALKTAVEKAREPVTFNKDDVKLVNGKTMQKGKE